MTTENSDAFTYIGCHYVDLVHFITGLLPESVSVYGIARPIPNGNEGFLWTDARVIWNNGACLNVQNALSFPDDGAGHQHAGITHVLRGGRSRRDAAPLRSISRPGVRLHERPAHRAPQLTPSPARIISSMSIWAARA